MSFEEVLLSAEPEPGEALEELEKDLSNERTDYLGISDPVDTLSEQENLVNKRLDYYLKNLSETPGARKVVEEFYEEEHGVQIDAADPDELRSYIPNFESILNEKSLPTVSKEGLREKYGVDGSWMVDENLHLSPNWVVESDEEPMVISETGGTTGRPWHRPMTRNDCALQIAGAADTISQVLGENNVSFNEANLLFPYPNWYWTPREDDFIHKMISDYTGVSIKAIDFNELKPGKTEVAQEAIEYLNKSGFSVVMGPARFLMHGKMGVSIRRGDVDIDVVINAGSPISEDTSTTLKKQGISIYEFYGETEYPQRSELKKEVEGVSGFELPYTSQVNLVLDEESGELEYEGKGRLCYFSFGVDGQIVPGVYVSGVSGRIRKLGESHQLLQNVERVQEMEGGCADPS